MYCLLRPFFQMSLQRLSRIKLKHVCIGFGIVFVLDFFGVFTHMFETSYDEKFSYPYEGDIHEFVAALRHNKKPSVPPINIYNYSYIHDIRDKCIETSYHQLRLVLLVKSAVENYNRRMGIRHSWGFEKRFSDVSVKTIFLLGTHEGDDELRTRINAEAVKYNDIVQINFVDSYYNNTIKTMMGFKWAASYCSNAKFYMFVDDDMYVSLKNILRFVRNPTLYPEYLTDSVKFKDVAHLKDRTKRSSANNSTIIYDNQVDENRKQINSEDGINKVDTAYTKLKNRIEKVVDDKTNRNKNSKHIMKRQVFDFELPEDVRLFAGYVFVSAPHRHKTSKWYVSLKEYPYHMWPPYVTAGAYIVSKEALLDLYYASMYTKHFRFDDVFLGLVAKKADIEPFHCPEFHFYKKEYTVYNYKYIISSHGYGDPDELLRVWNEQKAMGNA